MEKAKQSFEGLESYETGKIIGFEEGEILSKRIINCWLDIAYKMTSNKDEFYNFMKDTLKLSGGIKHE